MAENWQVINLQRFTWSDRRAVDFTVNLAVGLADLREGQLSWADGKRPPESRCHLRERLGFLLRGEDVHWTVDKRTNVAQLADVLNTSLTDCALPWLDARSTVESLLELVRTPAGIRETPWEHLYSLERVAQSIGDETLAHDIAAGRGRRERELDEVDST